MPLVLCVAGAVALVVRGMNDMSTLREILENNLDMKINNGSETYTCEFLLEDMQGSDEGLKILDSDDWGILDGYLYRGDNKLSGYEIAE